MKLSNLYRYGKRRDHKTYFTYISEAAQDKIIEVSDFADFILKKYDDEILRKGIEKLTVVSKTFEFLNHEEDLYTEKDLKERF